MRIEDILALEPTKMISELEKGAKVVETEWRDEYDGEHAILRKLNKEIGEGENARTIILAKLVANFQKLIVNSAVSFLFGRPATLSRTSDDTTKDAFDAIRTLLKKKKVNALNKALARDLFIETKVAELWYAYKPTPESETKIGVIQLSERTGNKIYPHFDENGDMDAFARSFSRDISDSVNTNKKEMVVEIYTAEKIIILTNTGGGWIPTEKPNPFKKIPVVYYEQDVPEWDDVQTFIDRFEYLISSHADTNDYNGSPIIKGYGELADLPEKGQAGKFLLFKGEVGVDGKMQYGDASYLTWDQAPESIKLEIENLWRLIHTISQTPDISLDNMKGIGNVTGIALKLMFLAPLLKAMDKQEIFEAGIERRISILKSILAFSDVKLAPALDNLEVEITFHDCLPENTSELVTMLSGAVGGEPIMSQETAVKHNPLVADADSEMKLIASESETNMRSIITGTSFNG